MKSKKNWNRFLIYILGFILLFSSASEGKALEEAYQSVNAPVNFCVMESPDISSFPDVGVTFRAYDQRLEPLTNLSAKDIRISENGQQPIQIQSGMQEYSAGLGVDFHIIINRGNRTDQSAVKNILLSFLKIYDQNKDRAYIYTDEGNSLKEYFTPNSGKSLAKTISEYPVDKVPSFRVMNAAIRGTLDNLMLDKDNCQRPRFLFLLMGDDVVEEDNIADYAKNILLTNTKLIIFHTPTTAGNLKLSDRYKDFAEKANGSYISTVDGDVTASMSVIPAYRKTYEIKYRSLSGDNDRRALSFVYQGTSYPTQGVGSYAIGLMPPQVSVNAPSVIERTAIETTETGFIYDIKDANISVSVSFPDQFPRKVETVVLVINQPGEPELRVPVSPSSSNDNTYNFRWLLGDIGDNLQTDISIRAEVVDDLGIVSSSPEVTVSVISYKPLVKVVQKYYLYAAAGLIGLLLLVITLMWRRIKNSAIGRRITSVAQNVRKTLLGGGPRGKPLASLRVIEGPTNMINQELKIHTESIKLGRDPQKADMTFYGVNVNSSISGLHARIERVNQSWRIVALSTSGSETFIDDAPIPFNQPQPLSDGQMIRLGYPAQQPVVFEFKDISQSVGKTEMPRATEMPRSTEMPRTTDVGKDAMSLNRSSDLDDKAQLSGQDDDIFNEYRDR